jgi:hypothetical protein
LLPLRAVAGWELLDRVAGRDRVDFLAGVAYQTCPEQVASPRRSCGELWSWSPSAGLLMLLLRPLSSDPRRVGALSRANIGQHPQAMMGA